MISIKTVIKNLAKASVAPIITAVASFLLIPLISRAFPTEEYGYINVFYTSSTILSSLFLLGFSDCFQRYYFQNDEKINRDTILSAGIIGSLIIDFCFTVFFLTCLPDLSENMISDSKSAAPVVSLSICCACQCVFSFCMLYSRMTYNYKEYNIQQLLQFAALRISFAFAGLISSKHTYSIYTITFSMLLVTSFYVVKQRKTLFRNITIKNLPNLTILWELLTYGFPIMITNVSMTINGSIGKFFLNGQSMQSETGVFSIATSLAFSISFISASFRNYWAPFMFEQYEKEQTIIKNMHEYVMYISAIFTVLIFAFQDIFYGIVGAEYRASKVYFMMLMLNPIQAFICETTSYGIMIAKKTKYSMYSLLLATIVNTFAAFILVPHLGGLGAAIGVLLSSIIIFLAKTCIGQFFYSSVYNLGKTFLVFSMIIGISILNYYVANRIDIRIPLSCLLAAAFTFLYKKDLLNLLHDIKRNRGLNP